MFFCKRAFTENKRTPENPREKKNEKKKERKKKLAA
jgi:hypothetical protein